MKLIDMHCDTIWKFEIVERLTPNGSAQPENLYDNTGHISVSGMKEAGTIAQFFANFTYMDWYENDYEKGYTAVLSMIERTKKEIQIARDDIQMVTSFAELQKLQGKIGAFLTIEEGGVINGKMERLHELYGQGIRLMTPIWNYENCMGYPTSEDTDRMNRGLKPFGLEVIQEMNRLGMIIDVSHMSDGGFWDCIEHSTKPVVASHSNARAICAAPRNLTDEMMRALAKKGGVSGVNFYPYFVKKDGTCKVIDIASHVSHMIQVGGEDLPAVGTDFDGYDQGESDINHVSQMDLFYDALKKTGLTDRQVDKVCYQNAQRIIQEVL